MHVNGHHHDPLPPPDPAVTGEHLQAVARALGDSPETVISLQFLREESADVLIVGVPEHLEGVIIQSREMPEEPMAFGASAAAIADLLPHLAGWACINVPVALADDLIEPVATVAEATGVRLLDDVYHALHAPVPEGLDGKALLLTRGDDDLVVRAPVELVGTGVNRLLDTLDHGHVAGVIERGGLVALAYTFATSERHADVGVVTHPDWRGRGYGTSVAAVVARAIQRDGRIPVWSCSVTNLASMAIAARLGFEEVSRRTYLIPEWDDTSGTG